MAVKKTTKTSKRKPRAAAKAAPKTETGAAAKAETTPPAPAAARADRSADARTRLKALKARRAALQTIPDPAPAAAGGDDGTGGGGGGLAAFLGGGAPSKLHGKILTQIYGILTQSAGSDTKMVPGTQFSEQGVQDLMQKLHRRAAHPEQKGAKVAKMLLSFLTPKGGEEAVIAGASLDKLRVLSGAANRVVKGK
ncbi:hypothetical protein [Shimia sp.]|uniref:hypothetical protein n=1 Tax=Shimia sp. TaxID=1954381 RepID=UPI003567DAE0